jgi:hypothetical protein
MVVSKTIAERHVGSNPTGGTNAFSLARHLVEVGDADHAFLHDADQVLAAAIEEPPGGQAATT